MTGRQLDVSRLRRLVETQIAKGAPAIMAIDGKGGSGKSTLARQIVDGWPRAMLVQMDDFYQPVANRQINPVEPGANFDRDRIIREVLQPHLDGNASRYQRYDWDKDALAEFHDVASDCIVVLEGVYSTSDPLREFASLRIWVETSAATRLTRGIERDGEAMRETWVNQWMPAEDKYVDLQHPANFAHLVVSGDGTNGEYFEILSQSRTVSDELASEHGAR